MRAHCVRGVEPLLREDVSRGTGPGEGAGRGGKGEGREGLPPGPPWPFAPPCSSPGPAGPFMKDGVPALARGGGGRIARATVALCGARTISQRQ